MIFENKQKAMGAKAVNREQQDRYPLTDGRQDEKKRVRKTSLIAPDKKTRTIKKMNQWNAFIRFSIVLGFCLVVVTGACSGLDWNSGFW